MTNTNIGGREAAALELCREFPDQCRGSGGMGGAGGPCGVHLDVAAEVDPDDSAPFDCPDCDLTVKHHHPKPMLLVTPEQLRGGRCQECGSSVPGWRHFRGCSRDQAALALCREFPDQCRGSGGMGGDGGPCGAHLEVANEVHPDVMPEFIAQVRDDLRRLW